jgi:hypothetical protein
MRLIFYTKRNNRVRRKAIVNDGRKGVAQSFGLIPVQLCQFHQVAIIRDI